MKRKRKVDKGDTPLDEKSRDCVLILPVSKSRCKSEIINEIRQLVRESNELTFKANLLALYHVTRILQEGKEPPILDRNFFALCLCICNNGTKPTKKKAADCGLMQSLEELYGIDKPVCDIKRNGNIIQYDAVNMATVYENDNNIAIYDHMVHYVRAKYRFTRKGHARWIMNRYVASDPLNFDVLPRNMPYSIEDVIKIIETENLLWLDHREKKRLQYRFMMLKCIEEQSTEEYTYKSFSLIPLRTMGVKYVDIDIQGIIDVWDRLKPCRMKKSNTTEEQKALLEWNAYRQGKNKIQDWFVFPKRGNKFVPGRMVTTNGYEFHFHFEKNKKRTDRGFAPKRAKKDICEDIDFDPDYVFINETKVNVDDPRCFAAADVGNHNLFTAVSPTGKIHQNGTPEMEVRNYTKRRYNHSSFRDRVNGRVASLRERSGIQCLMDQLSANSLKTSNLQALRERILVHCHIYGTIYDVFSNHQYQKLKVTARMKEKRTIDEMIHWITWGGKKPLGIGDGSKTSGLKGTTPGGPIRKLRRHAIKRGYEWNLVKEHYTSKRSGCCAGADVKPMKNACGDDIHGVRICKRCGKTCDRDLNSGFQIFHIYYKDQVRGEGRPVQYQKNFEVEFAKGWSEDITSLLV